MSAKSKTKSGATATKGTKGTVNRPKHENRTGSKQTPAVSQYMSQEFEDEYNKRGDFIKLLIKRLGNYGEDEGKIEKAYQENDLPPPIPNGAAATVSQSADKDTQIKSLTDRNQELLKDMEKMKKESKHPTSTTHQSREKTDNQDDNDNDTETLKGNLQKSQDEVRKIRNELEERKNKMETLKRENEELKTKSEDSKKTNADLMDKNEALESKVEELEQFKKDVTDSKQNRYMEKDMGKKQLQTQKPSLSQDRVSSGKQREQLVALQKAIAELEEENKKKAEDAVELKREYSNIRKDSERKNKEINQLQEEKSDLQKDSERQKEKLKTNEELVAKLEMDMKKLQRENAELIAKSEGKEREIEELKKEKANHVNVSQEKNKRGRQADKPSSEETISKLRDEVEGLRNRLSKMAGAQLTDNNPAIADLSDPNRPLSLGEKFSELYDNEWTDAMEELSDTISDEKIVIKQLLSIVCDAYQFCLNKSDEFMDKINGSLSGFSEDLGSSDVMPKEVAKTNKDYRKSLAVYVVSYLQQDFAKVEKAKSKSPVGKATESYMKKCVSVCWFMTVQDPKVCITTDPPDVFDEDQYKPYTKKGKHTDYLVWPVLHLHKGGPLIGKGVAQGKP